jgi:hypothetical protein
MGLNPKPMKNNNSLSVLIVALARSAFEAPTRSTEYFSTGATS